jgi:transcription initiation factor TFIID TATA-box-binding protein
MRFGETRMLESRVTIENVVLSCNLSEEVDMRAVHAALEGSTMNNGRRFPGIKYKMKGLRATIMIFRGRNIVCTGAPTKSLAEKAVQSIIDDLRSKGIVSEKCKYTCSTQNMIGSIRVMNAEFDLEGLVERGKAVMDKRRFPAAIMKIREMGATFLLFPKGKIVCSGVRSEEEMREAVRRLLEFLEREHLVVTALQSPRSPQR